MGRNLITRLSPTPDTLSSRSDTKNNPAKCNKAEYFELQAE